MSPINILMPVYNSEKYLSESIESILNQTFTNFNFLILDDCSTDDSLDIIKNYASQDKRIIVLQNEINLGRPISRNILLSEQKKYPSTYCSWMDSDDIAMPLRLKKQFSYMQQHPGVDILGSYMRVFGNENHFQKPPQNNKEIHSLMFIGSPIMHPTVLLKTDLIEKGLIEYDKEFPVAQDFDLWTRLCGKVKFNNIAEPLVKYRKHSMQATNRVEVIRFYHLKSVSKWYENIGIQVSNKFLYEMIFDRKLTSKESINQRGYFIKKVLGMKNFYGYKRISSSVLRTMIKRCYGQLHFNLYIYKELIKDIGILCTIKNMYKLFD